MMVHELLVEKKRPGEIARLVDAAPQTVSGDIKWLEKGWRKDLLEDVEKVRLLELESLRQAEEQLWVRWRLTFMPSYMHLIIKVKDQIAKIVGLYPKELAPGSSPTHPMFVAPAGLPAGVDLSELSSELQEEALLWGAKVKAQLPHVRGRVVDGSARVLTS